MAGNEATLMSAAFFDFIGHIATAAQDDSEEQERIIVIGNRIAALHEAYAKAAENEAQLAEANNKLQDLLQVPALSDAKAKGAPLATQNETKTVSRWCRWIPSKRQTRKLTRWRQKVRSTPHSY